MRIISGTKRGVKLKTLDGLNTRPTLDRVKESLFNIISNKIADSTVLDLFAGSGALGIESLSRGAKYCIFCDYKKEAIDVIKYNIEKTGFKEISKIMKTDYIECLKDLGNRKDSFDIIFVDPPYEGKDRTKALKEIAKEDLLSPNGIIIVETDEENEIEEIKNLRTDLNVYDIRKYGRVRLVFLSRKG